MTVIYNSNIYTGGVPVLLPSCPELPPQWGTVWKRGPVVGGLDPPLEG